MKGATKKLKSIQILRGDSMFDGILQPYIIFSA